MVVPKLAGGPPRRNGKSLKMISTHILSIKTKPTYYNVPRAWKILGYSGQPKPSFPKFCEEVGAMWEFISPNDRRGRIIRAYILDALRALRCYTAKWNPRTQALNINHQHLLGRSSAASVLAHWATVEGPSSGVMPNDADCLKEYFEMEPLKEPQIDIPHPTDMEMWQRYHPYQEFQALSSADVAQTFKVIPVPDGPEALWHCVSYWWGPDRTDPVKIPHGRDMMKNREMKALLWVYFSHVIYTPEHPRWREYILFQLRSKIFSEDYGELSILRSLYCNQMEHGLACDSALFDDILFVIADFFQTQVVVFYWDADRLVDDPWAAEPPEPPIKAGELQPWWPQKLHLYSWKTYGTSVPGRAQIFLARRPSTKHYDIAMPKFHAGNWPTTNSHPPGIPWWEPFQPGGPRVIDDPPALLDPPPCDLPEFTKPDPEEDEADDDSQGENLLSMDTLDLFKGGRDIPGDMFRLPSQEEADKWEEYEQPLPGPDQPRLPAHQCYQVRFGPRRPGGRNAYRPPPLLEDPIRAFEDYL